MEEGRRGIGDDSNTIFVALGKEPINYKSTLRWVLENSQGMEICIVYVYELSSEISVRNGVSTNLVFPNKDKTHKRVRVSNLREHKLAEFREHEELVIRGNIDSLISVCPTYQKNIRCMVHGADSVEQGIVEVISLYKARQLVMGAAKDIGALSRVMGAAKDIGALSMAAAKHSGAFSMSAAKHKGAFSRLVISSIREMTEMTEPTSTEMTEPTSTKANYVRQHAPNYCQLQFIDRGKLVCTREGVGEPSIPDLEQRPSNALGINQSDTGAESSDNDGLFFQLQQIILNTGYSIRRQKTEIENICEEYLVKKLRDFKLEKNEALEEAEEAMIPSTPFTPVLPSLFSTSELENATNNFDSSTKIGEGGYGFIYKGLLGHTEVAIKVPHTDGIQGSLEFQREMDALSNLRHPNLVTLVGACLESSTLIYEYLNGGSLEDRLNCKDDSLPLPWETRIRIATELCGVIVFLHSNKPIGIIHGDLKPGNILLDENLVCKLSDFGICHLLSRTENLTNHDTSIFTNPRGTFSYMDPEFLTTGRLSKHSDVYSFGVILLRLLTGKPAIGIANEVRNAWVSDNNVNNILDPLAGEWPSLHVIELVRMALSCCEMKKSKRPDLVDIWRFLKLIRALCMGLSTHQRVSDDDPPTYFLCPIFQEIMEDPHFAADGFTYEKKAIEGWLEFCNSSPMTNISLQDTNIVPNRALQISIRKWLQQNDTP